jgi:hypothetical protein
MRQDGRRVRICVVWQVASFAVVYRENGIVFRDIELRGVEGERPVNNSSAIDGECSVDELRTVASVASSIVEFRVRYLRYIDLGSIREASA